MGTRINKFIADSGLCSRRQADKLVEEGRVSIDGRTAVPGDTVTDGSAVSLYSISREVSSAPAPKKRKTTS